MDNEQRIRERARLIWEREGKPAGRENEFRARAARELGINVVAGEGDGPSQGGSPVTVISGNTAQEEPPYASVGPGTERTG